MLYFRMLLILGVTLYTSRVVIDALGVEDYGIYNVVGGVVAMFTMISGALSSAISRFITFELGRGDQDRLNDIFSTSVVIQVVIAAIIVVLVESVGVWFLMHKMVIPAPRFVSASWVLQFSLVTLIINLISVPYTAVIIAHERMRAFAYISILQVVGQLAVAYFISFASFDKLIFYAILTTLVALCVRLAYGVYCSNHFEECRKVRFSFDREVFSKMFSFAGWNFFGTASALIRDQGGNIILNILGGGPVVNAARAISTQVNGAIVGFSNNFMIALDPQITKSYASNNRHYMMSLIFKGSRYAFYMLLVISLPIIICTPYILELWLKNVPDLTVIFVRLTLVFGICDAISRPAIIAIIATGEIRDCQIIVGCIQILNLPLSYLALKMGYPPQWVLIIAIALILLCLLVRLLVLRGLIGLSVNLFAKEVLLNIFVVGVVSALLPMLIHSLMPSVNLWSTLLIFGVSLVATLATIYTLGCSEGEREIVRERVSQVIQRVRK